jgi:hypothetical protein
MIDPGRMLPRWGGIVVVVVCMLWSGCATVRTVLRRSAEPGDPRALAEVQPAEVAPDPTTPPPAPEPAPEPPPPPRREATISSPRVVKATAGLSTTIQQKAIAAPGTRVVVSLRARTLWLMKGNTVVFRAPIAIGMTKGFSYQGRSWTFNTPISERRILGKAKDPIWTIPDWHYYEKVVRRGLVPVRLVPGKKTPLADGTHIEIRENQVGRVNQFGNFAPLTVGNEILFDGKIFIPPTTTAQRRVPGILGPYKLDMGDGYLIHGTDRESSIGEAVSHGCVRMYNSDVERLYELVPVGTAVYIF